MGMPGAAEEEDMKAKTKVRAGALNAYLRLK